MPLAYIWGNQVEYTELYTLVQVHADGIGYRGVPMQSQILQVGDQAEGLYGFGWEDAGFGAGKLLLPNGIAGVPPSPSPYLSRMPYALYGGHVYVLIIAALQVAAAAQAR